MAIVAAVVVTAGNASAGPLVLSSGQSIVVDTDQLLIHGDASAVGTGTGDRAVFVFDAIDLPAGVNITLQGSRSVELLSRTGINLGTALSASGGDGQPMTGGVGPGGAGVIGGFDGGDAAQDGFGPGGGLKPVAAGGCCGGGTGGGYGGDGGINNENMPGGSAYGTETLAALIGGSGGGGGGFYNDDGSGGGAGGGAISLVTLGSLTLQPTARIDVNGGDGQAYRSGGGGSGGAVRLVGDNVDLQAGAQLNAAGGSTPFGGTHNRGGGGGGGGRVALHGVTSLNNNATVDVSGGTGTGNGQPGTVSSSLGTTEVSSLDLGSGTYAMWIDTDTATMYYMGESSGMAMGTVGSGVTTFNFDQIDLGPGVEVTLVGENGLSLVSQGDVRIATTLDASGGDGLLNTDVSGEAGFGGAGILGGGDGGRAGQGPGLPGQAGEGPGGGGGQAHCCGGGSGGGYGGEGGLPKVDTDDALPAGAIYGDPTLSDLLGGSGGGGGAGTHANLFDAGGGGGAGGGALHIVSLSGDIDIADSGALFALGGDGVGHRSGGGGSGGALFLEADSGLISVEGLLSVDGGNGSDSNRGGGGGGGGRIYLNALELFLDGQAQAPGFLTSGDYLSALGGTAHPVGGNPGLSGTILFEIPEPSTAMILILGAFGIMASRRRRKR